MLESDVALRELILKTVTERAAEHGGTLTRADLSHLMLPNGLEVRVIDQSRGIWNPRSMDATLSVVSNPDGPYSDRHVAGGLFHYSYRAGSDEGDNRKLRRAFELELPIILLQRLEPGVFVTHAPVYVVDDLRDHREFLLALDESVRFLPKDLPVDAPQRRYARGWSGNVCTRPSSGDGSSARTERGAPSARWRMASCWTPPTSSKTPRTRAYRS